MPDTLPNSFPWLVIDLSGEHEPTGCWNEQAAASLADRLSLSGARHVAVGRPHGSPSRSRRPRRGPVLLVPAEPWPCAGSVVVTAAQINPRRERGLNRSSDAPSGWRWRSVGFPNLIGPRRLRRSEAIADAEATFDNITGWTRRKNASVAEVAVQTVPVPCERLGA